MPEKTVIVIHLGQGKPFVFNVAEKMILNKSIDAKLPPDSRYAIINGKLDEKPSVKAPTKAPQIKVETQKQTKNEISSSTVTQSKGRRPENKRN